MSAAVDLVRLSGEVWADAFVAEADRRVRADATQVQSMLAAHRGVLVWERYYGGVERDVQWGPPPPGEVIGLGPEYAVAWSSGQVHNIKSATKSVMSTITGIAVERGDLESVDLPVRDLLPAYFAGVDSGKQDITLQHLLAMRSGLDWVENGPATYDWVAAQDPVDFTVRELQLIATPGERWCYSTADTHLLSAAVAAATGVDNLTYARRHLFGKLGFGEHRWTVDPQGRVIGGSELFLNGRDMLRFGQMVLQHGIVGDEPVVPAAWLAESTAAQPGLDGAGILALMMLSAPEGMQWPEGVRQYAEGYGYLWWRSTLAGYPVYYAQGLGGQLIVIVEDLDLVVVQTCSTMLEMSEDSPRRAEHAVRLIEDCLIPDVLARAGAATA